MKEYLKIIIYFFIFILLIIVCVKGYERLTQNYTPQSISSEMANDEKQETTELQKATDFTVTNMSGEKVSLSDYIGKPVVVNFWATWCPPCKSELPAFDKLFKEYEGQVEFMMVDLADGYQETVEGAKQFVNENQYEFPVFFDTEFSASNAYTLYSIPQTIFVDKEGNLVTSHTGAMSEGTLKQYINLLIGE